MEASHRGAPKDVEVGWVNARDVTLVAAPMSEAEIAAFYESGRAPARDFAKLAAWPGAVKRRFGD